MNKIKKDDIVIVITGKDKGKSGKVIEVDHKKNKVLVTGVNMVTMHKKAGKDKGAQESAIVKQEQYLDLSNVMLSIDGKPTRVCFKIDGDKKVRVAKKTGKVIK